LACADGGSEIDIIDLEGDLITSYSIGDSIWSPSWSPDGEWIAFTRSVDAPQSSDTINILSLDDGRIIQLTDNCNAGCYASFWLEIP
jgi:Tol biopolymer transport system component